MPQAKLLDAGKILALSSGDKVQHRYHAIWLRDNANDDSTRDPGNHQRLMTLAQIPRQVTISRVQLRDQSVALEFQPECNEIDFKLDWLLEHSYDKTPQASTISPHLQTWDAGLEIPVGNFLQVHKSAQALHQWLSQVSRYGFAVLEGGPAESEALLKVAALFGYVRETNYGKYFNVRTEINPVNLAYTGLGLQAHTDNPYRDPVPTMQILYCLENSADGGESMVIDGFCAAEKLRHENPQWFEVLSKYHMTFEFAGEQGVRLTSSKPMIELAAGGEIQAIRFNNRSAAAVTNVPFELMPVYYEAYRRFGEIIDDPAMAVTFKLRPGECFIVDNTRVLHARGAYSGAGTRWLQGCYPDKDGLMSTIAVLDAQLQSEKSYS